MSQDEAMREAIREAERAGVRLVPRPPDDVLSILKVHVFRQSYYPFERTRMIEWLASFGEAERPWGCDQMVIPRPDEDLTNWLGWKSLDWQWAGGHGTQHDRDMAKKCQEWLESWGGELHPP